MSYPYQNPYNYNPYGQPVPPQNYHPNANAHTDIYGQPKLNPVHLSQEKNLLLKEVEQNFNVKVLTNQMINNIKGDIVNINLVVTKDLSLPIEMYFLNFCFLRKNVKILKKSMR